MTPTDTLRDACRDFFGTDDPSEWVEYLSNTPGRSVELTRQRCNGKVLFRATVGWKVSSSKYNSRRNSWIGRGRTWRQAMSSFYPNPTDAVVDACYEYITDPSHRYAGATHTTTTPTEVTA